MPEPLTNQTIDNLEASIRGSLEFLLKMHPKVSAEEAKHEAEVAARKAMQHVRVFLSEVEE